MLKLSYGERRLGSDLPPSFIPPLGSVDRRGRAAGA